MTKKKRALKWQNFLWLTLSGTINAVGVTLFLAPLNLYDSGLSGTSLLLWQVTNQKFALSMFLVILNLPFFIFGFKKQGLAFTIYSLYAVAVYSVVAYILQNLIPWDLSVSPIAGNDMLLCSIFGGLVSGVGSGLTIRFGGAIDGVEVMAVIFAKYIGMTIGTFVMAYNSIIYVAAGIIFKSWTIPLYSVIAYAVGVKTVDYVVDGFDKAKAVIIITTKGEEISHKISTTLARSITVLKAKGYYSGNDREMLYCVVNRFQIGKIKKLVAETDGGAFCSVSEVSDTLGTSLKYGRKKKGKANKNINIDAVNNMNIVDGIESELEEYRPIDFSDAERAEREDENNAEREEENIDAKREENNA